MTCNTRPRFARIRMKTCTKIRYTKFHSQWPPATTRSRKTTLRLVVLSRMLPPCVFRDLISPLQGIEMKYLPAQLCTEILCFYDGFGPAGSIRVVEDEFILIAKQTLALAGLKHFRIFVLRRWVHSPT
mmetsp:Transcript_128317/g.410300  ORF Transcript_128317/g.410300 Transcript_128317/m.410300 type:complete len:128 (+) Transcript_128317:635-1018(+)